MRISLQETPSSAPPYVQSASLGTPTSLHKSTSKMTPKFNISKRNSSHKRRWGTLMEAAKSGKVSKFINRSRSEDSVCNSKSARHSNSPGSDENPTESQTDSNPSLVDALGSGLSSLQSGLSNFGLGSGALAVLRRKRKKFSNSRTKNCTKSDDKSSDLVTISGAYVITDESKNKKLLKRASSVPTRNPETEDVVKFAQFSESFKELEAKLSNKEDNLETNASETGEHSTVNQQQEETSPIISSTNEQELSFKSRNGSATLPNLPGVQPVSGSHGWL